MLGDIAQCLGEDRLGQRLDPGRNGDLGRPHHLDLGPRRLNHARQFGSKRRPGLLGDRGQGPLQGAAQIAQRLLHLDPAALPLDRVQRLLGAEGQGHAEQPLHDPLVDLPGQLQTLAQPPVALLLAGGVAGCRDQRRRLAERPQQMALPVGQLEDSAATVGADHPVGAAGGTERRADERRDPEQLGVLRWNLVLDPVRDDDHLVLQQRPLRDRRRQQRR